MNYIYVNPNGRIDRKITFFSLPKPFVGHIGIVQYNAILSWTSLVPKPEIVLYGNETGTAEIAKKFNLIHVAEITRNEYGTPLLDGVFADIARRASSDLITYINADIIVGDDFVIAVNSVAENLRDFLIVGRRWNLDLPEKIESMADWQQNRAIAIAKSCLADDECKDYFVFPKHLFAEIPAFAIGRGYWDSWMVRKALTENYPVVDASLAIAPIHQNHAYTHIRGGKNAAYLGREATTNKALGKVDGKGNIARATWQLKPSEYLEQPQVSIVMTIDSYSGVIERTLLSVLVQKYCDYEIIILDRSCCPQTQAILKPYLSTINYFSCSKDVALDRFILQVTRGEFLIFLSEYHVLLPNTLAAQIDCFTREAATLDILLGGYKTVTVDRVVEYQPWYDLPDLANLTEQKLLSVKQNLVECSIAIRRCRLKTIDTNRFNWDRTSTAIDLVCYLIAVKGCRVKWWRETARVILNRK